MVQSVSVPLRGLYPYKGAPYHWLNHAGSKPGFRGTTLRSLNFCDNFFHNVRETACLLMRGGFSVFWLLYAYSIPREDGLIKAFVGIFFRKKIRLFSRFQTLWKIPPAFFSLLPTFSGKWREPVYSILCPVRSTQPYEFFERKWMICCMIWWAVWKPFSTKYLMINFCLY